MILTFYSAARWAQAAHRRRRRPMRAVLATQGKMVLEFAVADIGSEISQIIFLATGSQATDDQINNWTAAVDNGTSIDDVANAFVASTAFADYYNGGVPVDPNSAPTVTLTQEIIDHALFSYTASQVSAWVNSGETIGQVFEAFAMNDNWATYTATYYSGGDTVTVYDGNITPQTSIVNVGAEISQLIELATGDVPTTAQLAAWGNYYESGGSMESIAAAFVASTAFAEAYNNGSPVDPNSPINSVLADEIITHALGSASTAQVDAWAASGLTVSQVFLSFALGDQFTAATASENPQIPSIILATGAQTITLSAIPQAELQDTEIIFNNATNEMLAYPASSNAVNVSSATSTSQAIDLAIASASASQTSASIPAHTGVIDWMQYEGNTYIIEATNSTAVPEHQTTLNSTDTVVELMGVVDLSGAIFQGHGLTL